MNIDKLSKKERNLYNSMMESKSINGFIIVPQELAKECNIILDKVIMTFNRPKV